MKFFFLFIRHYLRGTFSDCVGPVFIKASLFSFTCYFWTGFLALKVLVEGGTSIFFLLTGNFEGLDDALWGSSWGTEGGWGLRVGWGPGADWGGEAGLGLPGFEAVLGLFLGAALALEDCTGLYLTPEASAGNLGQDSTCNSSNYLGNYDKTLISYLQLCGWIRGVAAVIIRLRVRLIHTKHRIEGKSAAL